MEFANANFDLEVDGGEEVQVVAHRLGGDVRILLDNKNEIGLPRRARLEASGLHVGDLAVSGSRVGGAHLSGSLEGGAITLDYDHNERPGEVALTMSVDRLRATAEVGSR